MEMLYTVSIIVVVMAVVLVALSGNHEHARNTARVAQVREYQTALNYVYSSTGHFPVFGTATTGTMCLGDYEDNRCWENGTSVLEQPTGLAASLVPTYMERIPPAESTLYGQGSGTIYEGMTYTYQNSGKSYTIRYFLEGNNEDCMLTNSTGSNVGDDTLCILNVTP